MKRREFFTTLIVGTAGVFVSACGSSDSVDAATSSGNCVQNGTSVTIASNHGHVLLVDKADVAAAAAKTYDIMGTADHTHSVTISAANFAQLMGNHAINVQSTVGAAHQHSVTVACA
jgi:hypothetical protein